MVGSFCENGHGVRTYLRRQLLMCKLEGGKRVAGGRD